MVSKLFSLLFLFILLTACEPGMSAENQASSGGDDLIIQEAEAVLTDFYQLLNQGAYEEAVEHYGGSYEELEYFNPMLDPDEKSALLAAACEFNGFSCLPVLKADLIEPVDLPILLFEVAYANPDGSRFVLGPCCGATEEEMPPVDVFTVQVSCEDGSSCKVMDLPPYVP